MIRHNIEDPWPYEHKVKRCSMPASVLTQWCNDNDVDKFCYSASIVAFEKREDAILYKMERG